MQLEGNRESILTVCSSGAIVANLIVLLAVSLGEIEQHDASQNGCPLDQSFVYALETHSKIIPIQLEGNRESILTVCSSWGIVANQIVLLARFPW